VIVHCRQEKRMKVIRGVLLDIDGTLVQSNDAHARSWVQALAEHGINVPYAEVRQRIGKGGDKLLPEVAGIDSESDQGKKLSQRRKEIFLKDYLPLLTPCPGARALLARMKQQGLKLAVASSAKNEELHQLLRVCGADEVIDTKTSSDDVENSKPDPDTVSAALDKVGLPADQVVFLGDTPYDVEAGVRAGVRVVAVRCGGWSDADLAGAAAVYQDPGDLLAHYASSPLAP